jgi:hypothetical protein
VHQELERHAVNTTWFVLEMKAGDELVDILDFQILLWYPFRNDIRIVVEADDGVVSVEFPEELMVAGLVNAYLPSLLLTGNLRLLDQSLDQIIDVATLRNEDVVVILALVSWDAVNGGFCAAHLFRNAFANQRELDVLLRIQLGKTHVQDLEVQGIVALVHVQLPIPLWIKDSLQCLILLALHRRPGITTSRMYCVEPQMCRLNAQPLTDLLCKFVVGHPGVQHHLKRWVLLTIALSWVSVELNQLLMQKKIVVLPGILKSIRCFVTGPELALAQR